MNPKRGACCRLGRYFHPRSCPSVGRTVWQLYVAIVHHVRLKAGPQFQWMTSVCSKMVKRLPAAPTFTAIFSALCWPQYLKVSYPVACWCHWCGGVPRRGHPASAHSSNLADMPTMCHGLQRGNFRLIFPIIGLTGHQSRTSSPHGSSQSCELG